ncbi:hypothetical protein [Mycobacterium uberis]|uniref:hypothetical protein n=1 Tax=Mycobacterium uberis TaxID=2162698 RepID=UPI001FB3B11C|nr:hypothetical protein [Mycobacterium uberis]
MPDRSDGMGTLAVDRGVYGIIGSSRTFRHLGAVVAALRALVIRVVQIGSK